MEEHHEWNLSVIGKLWSVVAIHKPERTRIIRTWQTVRKWKRRSQAYGMAYYYTMHAGISEEGGIVHLVWMIVSLLCSLFVTVKFIMLLIQGRLGFLFGALLLVGALILWAWGRLHSQEVLRIWYRANVRGLDAQRAYAAQVAEVIEQEVAAEADDPDNDDASGGSSDPDAPDDTDDTSADGSADPDDAGTATTDIDDDDWCPDW